MSGVILGWGGSSQMLQAAVDIGAAGPTYHHKLFGGEILLEPIQLTGLFESVGQPILDVVLHVVDRFARAAHGKRHKEEHRHENDERPTCKESRFHSLVLNSSSPGNGKGAMSPPSLAGVVGQQSAR